MVACQHVFLAIFLPYRIHDIIISQVIRFMIIEQVPLKESHRNAAHFPLFVGNTAHIYILKFLPRVTSHHQTPEITYVIIPCGGVASAFLREMSGSDQTD